MKTTLSIMGCAGQHASPESPHPTCHVCHCVALVFPPLPWPASRIPTYRKLIGWGSGYPPVTLISARPPVHGRGPDTPCCSGPSPAMRWLLHLRQRYCTDFSKTGSGPAHWVTGSNRHSAVCRTSSGKSRYYMQIHPRADEWGFASKILLAARATFFHFLNYFY